MIHDDVSFTLDSSDFPVGIEEFAAYIDGNLTDDDKQRVGTVIDESKDMQEIIDSCNSIDELYDYNEFVGDTIIPNEIERMEFDIPNLDAINICDLPVDYPQEEEVAACADAPTNLDLSVYEDESSYNSETINAPENPDILSSEGDSDLDSSSSADIDINMSFLDN